MKTDTVNYAGGVAYSMKAKNALAQLATTGCFNSTYYVSDEDQLSQLMALVRQCEPEFVAKVAVYARESGFMKDMPAALVAWLTTVDMSLCKKVFPKVINNGKMLRNFVQMIRSGAFGRHNVSSSAMRGLIRSWFATRTDEQIFYQSVGSNPSIGDVIKLARVRPMTQSRSALYAYFIGKETGKFAGIEFDTTANLPALVAAYETYRKSKEGRMPDAPFEMLLGLNPTNGDWRDIAQKATWTQTFKSLNTFARNGLFTDDKAMTDLIVDKLTDAEAIRKAKVFPFQILSAYKATKESVSSKKEGESRVPRKVREALCQAIEIATENVPAFEGKSVVICPDVSGSMCSNYITGNRKGSTTKVTAIEVASLITASILRRNQTATVLPFHTEVVSVPDLSPDRSIFENTNALAKIGGGGTDCSAPFRKLNQVSEKTPDVVILISDNESWSGYMSTQKSSVSLHWQSLLVRNPGAKLICLDLTPNNSTQVKDSASVLNIGGFSDVVFKVMEAFVKGSGNWIETIESIQL